MRRSLVCVLTGAVLAASMIGTVCLADEAKTFTVGFDAEYPPFGYMDEDGEYTGFDLELAQAVCDLQGWELVKQPCLLHTSAARSRSKPTYSPLSSRYP